jgi:hypothetical protein
VWELFRLIAVSLAADPVVIIILRFVAVHSVKRMTGCLAAILVASRENIVAPIHMFAWLISSNAMRAMNK